MGLKNKNFSPQGETKRGRNAILYQLCYFALQKLYVEGYSKSDTSDNATGRKEKHVGPGFHRGRKIDYCRSLGHNESAFGWTMRCRNF